MLYHSFFYSHLIYGITLWGFASKNKLNRIIKLQKKALRAIEGAGYTAQTDPIAKNLKILKFDQVLSLYLGKFMYRIVRGFTSDALRMFFPLKQTKHATRQDPNINIQDRNSELMNKSFLNKAPQIWLTIPEIIKNQNTMKLFTIKYTNQLGQY